MQTIGFFSTEALAQKKINELIENRLEGDLSTYELVPNGKSFEVRIDFKCTPMLQAHLDDLFELEKIEFDMLTNNRFK